MRKSFKNSMALEINFEGIFMDFGKDFGTKIEAEIDVIFEKRFFSKNLVFH